MLQTSNDRAVLLVVLISLLAVIAGTFSAIFITISILRQLGVDPSEIARIAKEIAEGNLAITFDDSKKIGGVHDSHKVMVEKLTEVVKTV